MCAMHVVHIRLTYCFISLNKECVVRMEYVRFFLLKKYRRWISLQNATKYFQETKQHKGCYSNSIIYQAFFTFLLSIFIRCFHYKFYDLFTSLYFGVLFFFYFCSFLQFLLLSFRKRHAGKINGQFIDC